jgi:hypothetical protein
VTSALEITWKATSDPFQAIAQAVVDQRQLGIAKVDSLPISALAETFHRLEGSSGQRG